MWNDPTELVVPGNGQAYVAAVGTAMPADNTDPTAALPSDWKGLGYWTEDGATFTVTPDITDYRAFQERQAVRRERNNMDYQAGFVMEQWNEITVPTALGGEIVSGGGFFTYHPAEPGDALEETALIVDLQDGDRNMRFCFPRGNTATEATETTFKRGELALLPVVFKALIPTDGSKPYKILFDDDDAFATGS